MGRIVLLAADVADQIAAGEVVERPASVVKELIDNAVDAGASEIDIRIEEGGISKIEVTDNGEGMNRDDLELAVARHGTSKLKQIEDLLRINTMGFRGEALASVAAVSRFTLKSAQVGNLSGYKIKIEGGKIISKGEVGMAKGTCVIVEDIFFNIPARKKFLRTSGTEWRYCLEMVERLALANVRVGIRLWHNSKLYLDLLAVEKYEERVKNIFGEDKSLMFQVVFDHPHWNMVGLIGKPQTGREKGAMQVAIVNNRVVNDRGIVRSVKEAMGSLLPPRYQVPWIIYINLPGEMVDVNVHPRKEEVRFVNPYGVYGAISKMIETSIGKENMRFVRGDDSGVEGEMQIGVKDIPFQSSDNWKFAKNSTGGMGIGRQMPNKIENMAGNDLFRQEEIFSNMESLMSNKVIQMHNLYILVEEEGGLVLIDQHAAHERIRYESLMEAANNKSTKSIETLLPIQIKLTKKEIEVLIENRLLLESVGLRFGLGEGSVDVLSVPMGWENTDMEGAIKGVIGDLLEGDKVDLLSDKQNKVLTFLSCRTAIKGGQSLTEFEMIELVKQLRKCKLPYTCPHGRPVEILVTWHELEKMFLRVGM